MSEGGEVSIPEQQENPLISTAVEAELVARISDKGTSPDDRVKMIVRLLDLGEALESAAVGESQEAIRAAVRQEQLNTNLAAVRRLGRQYVNDFGAANLEKQTRREAELRRRAAQKEPPAK